MAKGLGLSVKVQSKEMYGSALDVGCEGATARDRVEVAAGVWRPLRRRSPLAAWPSKKEHPITLTGVTHTGSVRVGALSLQTRCSLRRLCALCTPEQPSEGFVAESVNVAPVSGLRLPRARHVRRPRLASPAVIAVTPE